MTEPTLSQQPGPLPPGIEIRRLSYPDLPQVTAIERRVFPTPWSLAMFVLELSKAVRDLPGRRRRGAAGRLPDLLALRHRLARDERGRGLRSPAQGPRLRAAGRAVRAGRRRQRALHARGAALQPRRDPPVRARGLPRRRACAGATTRTTARTRSSCGARPPPWRARSRTCPTPRRREHPRARDELRRHLRGGPGAGRDDPLQRDLLAGAARPLRRGGARDRLPPSPRADRRRRRARRCAGPGATWRRSSWWPPPRARA